MELKKLIKLEKHCEENKKCPSCNDYNLVGCSPQELLFICTKCGLYLGYDEENDEIYICEVK